MIKKVTIEERVHSANEEIAAENEKRINNARLFSLNIMASPGAGKTSLIERTLDELTPEYNIAAIDGDVATSIDANRAAEAGATAVQINTGGQCHIDANMLQTALNEHSYIWVKDFWICDDAVPTLANVGTIGAVRNESLIHRHGSATIQSNPGMRVGQDRFGDWRKGYSVK